MKRVIIPLPLKVDSWQEPMEFGVFNSVDDLITVWNADMCALNVYACFVFLLFCFNTRYSTTTAVVPQPVAMATTYSTLATSLCKE